MNPAAPNAGGDTAPLPGDGWLARILEQKRDEVAKLAATTTRAALEQRCAEVPPPRGFGAALRCAWEAHRPGVIAELKRASPSKGLLCRDYDPARIARAYQRAGAHCLSVLTDRNHFMGRPEHLAEAAVAGLPLLRKDFLIDPLQILHSRLLGADCVLLIVAALTAEKLRELAMLARTLDMDVLVEVHEERELEQALRLPEDVLLGINNRNLRSFHTDLKVSHRLLAQIAPHRVAISESGIHSPEQVRALHAAGAKAFLVGEAFMRAADPGAKLRELFHPASRSSASRSPASRPIEGA